MILQNQRNAQLVRETTDQIAYSLILIRSEMDSLLLLNFF